MISNKRILIAPSILSADFSRMGEEVESLNIANADLIHCDVMDGVFVPNLTFGPKMIKDIRNKTKLPLDVHLMIVNPENYFDEYIDAGADILSFHIEATKNAKEGIDYIKVKGIKAGIVISPDTDESAIFDILKDIDVVTIMSVYPGFGGQKFLERVLPKVRALKEKRDTLNLNFDIEIDGGINFDTSKLAVSNGVNILVAGNTVFSSPDRAKAIKMLKESV